MTPELRAAVLDFDGLAGVLIRSADGLLEPDALQFQFEGGALRFSADAEDDSLVASLENGADGFLAVSDTAPWNVIAGGKVTAAWALRNNYGYEDGVELEVNLPSGAEVLLRLVVIASTIHASLLDVSFISWA